MKMEITDGEYIALIIFCIILFLLLVVLFVVAVVLYYRYRRSRRLLVGADGKSKTDEESLYRCPMFCCRSCCQPVMRTTSTKESRLIVTPKVVAVAPCEESKVDSKLSLRSEKQSQAQIITPPDGTVSASLPPLREERMYQKELSVSVNPNLSTNQPKSQVESEVVGEVTISNSVASLQTEAKPREGIVKPKEEEASEKKTIVLATTTAPGISGRVSMHSLGDANETKEAEPISSQRHPEKKVWPESELTPVEISGSSKPIPEPDNIKAAEPCEDKPYTRISPPADLQGDTCITNDKPDARPTSSHEVTPHSNEHQSSDNNARLEGGQIELIKPTELAVEDDQAADTSKNKINMPCGPENNGHPPSYPVGDNDSITTGEPIIDEKLEGSKLQNQELESQPTHTEDDSNSSSEGTKEAGDTEKAAAARKISSDSDNNSTEETKETNAAGDMVTTTVTRRRKKSDVQPRYLQPAKGHRDSQIQNQNAAVKVKAQPREPVLPRYLQPSRAQLLKNAEPSEDTDKTKTKPYRKPEAVLPRYLQPRKPRGDSLK